MTTFKTNEGKKPQGLKPIVVELLDAKAKALAYLRSKGNDRNNGRTKTTAWG